MKMEELKASLALRLDWTEGDLLDLLSKIEGVLDAFNRLPTPVDNFIVNMELEYNLNMVIRGRDSNITSVTFRDETV